MSITVNELMTSGHPCRARLVEYIAGMTEKHVARVAGCEVRTARAYRQGMSWPNETSLQAMAAEWGAGFLLYVFGPVLESELTNAQLAARVQRDFEILKRRVESAEREMAAAAAADRPAASRARGAADRIGRAAGGVLGALALVVMLAAPSDDFTRARAPRPPRPATTRTREA